MENIILIAVGATICFGGLYIKRFCAALSGLFWGALIGGIIVLITAESIFFLGEESTAPILLAAILLGCLSAILDRIGTAIQAFFSSFALIFVLLAILTSINIGGGAIFFLAFILALGLAVICYQFEKYAFMISTALTGGLIAGVGTVGLLGELKPEDLLWDLLWFDESTLGAILLAALLWAVAGCVVQSKRLKVLLQYDASEEIEQEETEKTDVAKERILIARQRWEQLAETVKQRLYTMVSRLSSATQNLVLEVKSVLKELKSSESKKNLAQEVVSAWYLLVAPVLSMAIVPLLYSTNQSLDGPVKLYAIILRIEFFAEAVSLGTMVYVVCRKNLKFNLAYLLPFVVFPIFIHFSMWSVFYQCVKVIRPLCVWAVLWIFKSLIEKKKTTIIALCITIIVLWYHLLRWLAYCRHSWHFDGRDLLAYGLMIAVAFALTELHDTGKLPNPNRCKKHNKSRQRICTNCGGQIGEHAVFCKYCGFQQPEQHTAAKKPLISDVVQKGWISTKNAAQIGKKFVLKAAQNWNWKRSCLISMIVAEVILVAFLLGKYVPGLSHQGQEAVSLSLYEQVLENAIQKRDQTTKSASMLWSDSVGEFNRGLLVDLNDDGCEELVVCSFLGSEYDLNIVLSIYAIEHNQIRVLVEDTVVFPYGVQADSGRCTLVERDGQIYVAKYHDSPGVGLTELANSEQWTLYRYEGDGVLSEETVYAVETLDVSNGPGTLIEEKSFCLIDGRSFPYSKYITWQNELRDMGFDESLPFEDILIQVTE